ncbi:hypothetical protein JCM3774_003361 [Rhodotorula dairenensis]
MCTVPVPSSSQLEEGADPSTRAVFWWQSDSRPPPLPAWDPAFPGGTTRRSTVGDAASDTGQAPVLGRPALNLELDLNLEQRGAFLHRPDQDHNRGPSGRGHYVRHESLATNPGAAGRTRSGSYFTPLAEGGFGSAGDTVPPRLRSEARRAIADDPSSPLPSDPIVSCSLWEEERCVVALVLVGDHAVARRTDTDYVNSTKLLNMVDGLSRGKRDMFLKNEADRQVFRRGALHLKGVWLPLEAAARLARDYNLSDRLYPLFEPAILPYLLLPVNRPRTTQLVTTARARRALLELPGQHGLAPQQRADVERRQASLEALLRRLENGLRGGPGGTAEPALEPVLQDRLHGLRPASDSALPARDRHPAGFHFDPATRQRHTSADPDRTGSTARHGCLGGRLDAMRRSMSTTVSSVGTRERCDSSASSSASSFSSLEFTPLESDNKGGAARADERPARTSSSYTLVLAPDAASSSSSASTSRPVSRSCLDGPGLGLGILRDRAPSDEERPPKRSRPDLE